MKAKIVKEKKSIFNYLSRKGIIIYMISYLLIIFLIWYFGLPFINLRIASSYLFFILVLGLPGSIAFMLIVKKNNNDYNFYDTKFFSKTNANRKITDWFKNDTIFNLLIKGFLTIMVGILIIIGIGELTSAKIFNAKKYQEQLEIVNNSEDNLKNDFDYTTNSVKLPSIDKDIAFKLAQAKLGDYGSQYSIDYDNFTIFSVTRNGKNELIRVTPLEYSQFFVSLSRMSKGTIGYIEVNVVTQETKLVKFEDGLKYMPSGILNYDLNRHIRFKEPTEYYENYYFQTDESGHPYWIVPTLKKEIGLFGGITPKGVLVVDPITGSIDKYKLGDEPSWIQRAVDERVLEKQANNAFKYKKGYWNTVFAKEEIFQLSDGYNYFMKNGQTYYISCITSPNENDQTSVGFIAINLKTKAAVRYQSLGITEMRAREIAEKDERVKAQKLDSTWPILISYHDVPTYFIVLKNAVQIQKIVFINVENGELVAMNDTFSAAQMDYESLLNDKGISSTDEKDIVSEITKIRDTGQTIEFMIKDINDTYFVVNVNVSLDARFLQVGDKVKIKYKDHPTYNYVIELEIIS